MLKITVKKTFRGLNQGDIYDFKDDYPIIVVGDNGCGKSSLFHALRGIKNDSPNNDSLYSSKYKELSDNIEVEHNYEKIFFYDSIKDDGRDFMVGYDAATYYNSGAFHTKDKSHGESSIINFGVFLEKIKDKIIPYKSLLVLDEIDKGFSLSLMVRFNDMLFNIQHKYKVHVIAVTHNPFAMTQNIIVYNFKTRDFELADKYIEKIGKVKIEFITSEEN